MTQQEIDIADWLLHHRDGLRDELRHLHRPCYHLFPDSVLDIYFEQYAEQAIAIVQNLAASTFQLNPEEKHNIISKHYLIKVLGHNFFEPEMV